MSHNPARVGFAVFICGAFLILGCRPCPHTVVESPPIAHTTSAESGPPIIGITGYVIEPGTRGDNGLGNYRVTRTYRDAVVRAGGLAIHLVPVPPEQIPELVSQLDGLLLAGGPDIDPSAYDEEPHPTVSVLPEERQSFDVALAREAIRQDLPILGICLGSQILNVVHGGSLIQDIPSEVGQEVSHREVEIPQFRTGVHEITLVEGTPLAELYENTTIRVNSAHHQASDVMGEGLEIAARAPDGVVEAFYRPEYPFLIGVQYHPEGQTEPPGQHDALFQAFIEAAADFQQRSRQN